MMSPHKRCQGTPADSNGNSIVMASTCPSGHELHPWAALPGTCDGCGRKVREDEQVMDCRRCNWYLCEACLPRDRARDPSLWGTLSAMPYYAIDVAAHDLGAIANIVSSSIGARDEDDNLESMNEVRKEATRLVYEFCMNYTEARVEPSHDELEVFWGRCSLLYAQVLQPAPIVSAIRAQLSREPNAADPRGGAGQPLVRCLHMLEHLHSKGVVGRAISDAVASHANEFLPRLSEDPLCRKKAFELITMWNLLDMAPQIEEEEEEDDGQNKLPMVYPEVGRAPLELDLLGLHAHTNMTLAI